MRKLEHGNELPETIVHNHKKYRYAAYHPLAIWDIEKAKRHKEAMEHTYPQMTYIIVPFITGIKTHPKVWGVYMREKQ